MLVGYDLDLKAVSGEYVSLQKLPQGKTWTLYRLLRPYNTGLITIYFGSLEQKIHSVSSIKGTLFTFFFLDYAVFKRPTFLTFTNFYFWYAFSEF